MVQRDLPGGSIMNDSLAVQSGDVPPVTLEMGSPQAPKLMVSPGASKPATYGRLKTSQYFGASEPRL
jgi:hypothetical protein